MMKLEIITKPYNMRRHFGDLLHAEMKNNKKIKVITADLGYGLFDQIMNDFPDQFLNCGAAEQLAVSLGIAAALNGYNPIIYSISSFLLLRPAEFIRNYLSHEQINVKLVGSGLDDDYKSQGYTHHLFKAEEYCSWMGIEYYYVDQHSLQYDFKNFIQSKKPSFLGLRK